MTGFRDGSAISWTELCAKRVGDGKLIIISMTVSGKNDRINTSSVMFIAKVGG